MRFDAVSKLLYSTDASMYQVEPIGVVIPRDARRRAGRAGGGPPAKGSPCSRAGGGTSLTGQTVNRALVLDFSALHEPGARGQHRGAVGARRARARPGRAQSPRAAAGAALRARHLHVEPRHPGRHDGQQFGRLALDRLRAHRRPRPRDPCAARRRHPAWSSSAHARRSSRRSAAPAGPGGQIYREVAAIRDTYATRSARATPLTGGGWPATTSTSCVGLGVRSAARPAASRTREAAGAVNMARLVVGSEGTLLTILEAKVRLVRRPEAHRGRRHPLPRHAGGAGVVAVHPGDRALRRRADGQAHPRPRARATSSSRGAWASSQGDPEAILIVEYAGDTEAEVRAKVEALEARRRRERLRLRGTRGAGRGRAAGHLEAAQGRARPPARHEGRQEAHRLRGGHLRRAAAPGGLRAALPARSSPSTTRSGAYYGHCSVGCLHIRPVIDLKTPRGLEQVRAIADEITDLVLEFDGTISSEHGDGRARSPYPRADVRAHHSCRPSGSSSGLRPREPA